MLVILLFIIIKAIIVKDDDDDIVFQFANLKDENFTRQTVFFLEQRNQTNYPKMYDFIEKYYADKRLTEAEKGKLEEFITHIYFKSFHKKWMAFRLANWTIKIFFLVVVLTAWIHFNSIFFSNEILIESWNIDWGYFALTNIFGFIVVYVISAGYLTLSSMIIQLISSFFNSKKGSLIKSYIFIDELVKCYKPAGRKTDFKLGNQKTNFRHF